MTKTYLNNKIKKKGKNTQTYNKMNASKENGENK